MRSRGFNGFCCAIALAAGGASAAGAEAFRLAVETDSLRAAVDVTSGDFDAAAPAGTAGRRRTPGDEVAGLSSARPLNRA